MIFQWAYWSEVIDHESQNITKVFEFQFINCSSNLRLPLASAPQLSYHMHDINTFHAINLSSNLFLFYCQSIQTQPITISAELSIYLPKQFFLLAQLIGNLQDGGTMILKQKYELTKNTKQVLHRLYGENYDESMQIESEGLFKEKQCLYLIKKIRCCKQDTAKISYFLYSIDNFQQYLEITIFKSPLINEDNIFMLLNNIYQNHSNKIAFLAFPHFSSKNSHNHIVLNLIWFYLYPYPQHEPSIETIVTQYELESDASSQISQLVNTQHILPPLNEHTTPMILVLSSFQTSYRITSFGSFKQVPQKHQYILPEGYTYLDSFSIKGSEQRVLLVLILEHIVIKKTMIVVHHQDMSSLKIQWKQVGRIDLNQELGTIQEVIEQYSKMHGYWINLRLKDKTGQERLVHMRFYQKNLLYMKMLVEITGEQDAQSIGKHVIEMIE